MSFHGFEARLLWIELPASWRERRVFDGEFPEDWQSALVSTLFALSAVFHEPFGLMRMTCNVMKSELSLIMEVAF